MVDVEVNVVIAVIVALLKDEEEQKKTKEKARHIVAEKEKPERGISDNWKWIVGGRHDHVPVIYGGRCCDIWSSGGDYIPKSVLIEVEVSLEFSLESAMLSFSRAGNPTKVAK